MAEGPRRDNESAEGIASIHSHVPPEQPLVAGRLTVDGDTAKADITLGPSDSTLSKQQDGAAEDIQAKSSTAKGELLSSAPSESNGASSSITADNNTTQPVTTAGPKVKFDWYQTSSQVILTLMVKKVSPQDLCVTLKENILGVAVNHPGGSDGEWTKSFHLQHPVDESASSLSTKLLSTKVEIKVKKVDGIHWTDLECKPGTKPTSGLVSTIIEPTPSAGSSSYPTSGLKKVDWNRIEADVVKEEKEEKPEGDAALNKLFQDIYSNATEETRRAMNKSFSESGGTVLSTNWKDIGKQETDVKPPDGMEYKKW